MDRILRGLGLAAGEEKLFDPKARDEKTTFHRMMRLAAMLHDIGTFPFSHSIEMAYINFWRNQAQVTKPKYNANHETLGSHIILNTDFDGGITRILKEEGIDPVELSRVIAGKSDNPLANQLMHADVDADRMDYLIRDAHHTGVKIGLFDLDFLIRALRLHGPEGHSQLCIHEDGINVVDSFLVARYFWYSQIIHEGTGYKFDLIAAKICEYFLENKKAYSFENLMEKVSLNPYEYFTFNDSYFMAKLHEYLAGRVKHPMIGELSEMLARRVPPAQIRVTPIKPTVVRDDEHRRQLVTQCMKATSWLKEEIRAIDKNAWVIDDIPHKDVMFTRNVQSLKKDKHDPLQSRDSVKVLTRHGEMKLLVDVSQSLMKILSQYRNFIPRVYLSTEVYSKLEKKGVLEKMRQINWEEM
jgi:HD superfamily phosphohydrolase